MILHRVKNYLKVKSFKKRYPSVKFGPRFNVEKVEAINNIDFSGFVYIGSDANWSPKGIIKIGSNVIIGPRSIIWTYNHNINSCSYIPYGPPSEDVVKDVVIKDNVWIGMNVIILPGCVIGEGAVVGAGSVVTKSVDEYAIVAGNPAKKIGVRDEKLFNKLKTKSCFYLSR